MVSCVFSSLGTSAGGNSLGDIAPSFPSSSWFVFQVPLCHRKCVGWASLEASSHQNCISIQLGDVATALPAVPAIVPLSLISTLANGMAEFEQLAHLEYIPTQASIKMASSSLAPYPLYRTHERLGFP